MNNGDYFVMLNHPNGRIYPMMEDDTNIAMFKDHEDAWNAAMENPLGEHYGFEVFERGTA